MPQKENGYTAISNEIMDALCRTRVAGEQRQVFDCILRKTYGWNKKEDRISLSQFMDMTGISKSHIIRAIKGLIDKNMIAKKGNDLGITYCIQKKYHLWNALPKKETLPKKEINVAKKGNVALPKKGHTKDTLTKDNTKDRKLKRKDFQKLLVDGDYIHDLSVSLNLTPREAKAHIQNVFDYCASKGKWQYVDLAAVYRQWNRDKPKEKKRKDL